MKRKLAALAIGGTALLGAGLPIAASASTTSPHRAGVCTVSGSYTESSGGGSFTVVATSDTCVGGGTIKWQAEEQCARSGGNLFTYSLWKNGADSAVAGDSSCADAQGGEMLDGYIRINMNNPERTTLWTAGDAVSGTFSVHS